MNYSGSNIFFNIQVTAICPGGVRTDFLDQTSMKRPSKQIEDYDVVRQTMSGFDRLNHNQSGDPVKVAQAIIAVTQMEQAPGPFILRRGSTCRITTSNQSCGRRSQSKCCFEPKYRT